MSLSTGSRLGPYEILVRLGAGGSFLILSESPDSNGKPELWRR